MKPGSIISVLREAVNFNYSVHSCLIIDAFFQAGGDLLGHLTGPWPPPDSQGDAQDLRSPSNMWLDPHPDCRPQGLGQPDSPALRGNEGKQQHTA